MARPENLPRERGSVPAVAGGRPATGSGFPPAHRVRADRRTSRRDSARAVRPVGPSSRERAGARVLRCTRRSMRRSMRRWVMSVRGASVRGVSPGRRGPEVHGGRGQRAGGRRRLLRLWSAARVEWVFSAPAVGSGPPRPRSGGDTTSASERRRPASGVRLSPGGPDDSRPSRPREASVGRRRRRAAPTSSERAHLSVGVADGHILGVIGRTRVADEVDTTRRSEGLRAAVCRGQLALPRAGQVRSRRVRSGGVGRGDPGPVLALRPPRLLGRPAGGERSLLRRRTRRSSLRRWSR